MTEPAAAPAPQSNGLDVERPAVDRNTDSVANVLRQGDAQARKEAARGLGTLNDPGAVAPLIDALTDRNGGVVREVVRSLGRIRDPRAVEALISTSERRSDLTAEVAAALRAIGGAEVETALSTLVPGRLAAVRGAISNCERELTTSYSIDEWYAASDMGSASSRQFQVEKKKLQGQVKALRKEEAALIRWLPDEERRQKVDALIVALSIESDPSGRIEIARALGDVGGPQAENTLAHLLRDSHRVEVGHWGTGDYFDVYFEAYHYPVGEAASAALKKIGGPVAKQALADWIAAGRPIGMDLPPTPPDVARLAASRDFTGLLEALEFSDVRHFQSQEKWGADREVGGSVRKAAAEALGRLGDRRAIEPLVERLNDHEPDVRQWAAEALGLLGDQRAGEPLVMCLDDDSPAVRTAASRALGLLGLSAVELKAASEAHAHEAAVSSLVDAGHRELDPAARKALIDKVATIGPRAIDLLHSAAADESRLVRKDVARVLGAIGGDGALANLARLLSDADPGVSETAAKAIRRIGGPEAQRLLANHDSA